MLPLFTGTNLCRLLIWPSSEWGRAGVRYLTGITRGIEFGIVECRFGWCPPIAWLWMLGA